MESISTDYQTIAKAPRKSRERSFAPVCQETIENVRKRFIDHTIHEPDAFANEDIEKVKTDDWPIYRFVSIHCNNEEKSLQALIETLQWRKKMNLWSLDENHFPDLIWRVGPLFIYEPDNQGRPTLYSRCKFVMGVKDISKWEQLFTAYQTWRVDEAANGNGWTLILDFAETGIRNADFDLLKFFLNLLMNHFPRGIDNILVINLPFILTNPSSLHFYSSYLYCCFSVLFKLITICLITMPLTNGITSTPSNQHPQIGKPAPVFKGTAVVNGAFKEISLNDYAGKYVVLFFYPLDFTFVCPTEIVAFSDRVREFQDIGCEIIACSTDSHFTHLAWVNTPRKQGGLGEMNIPLLADKNLSNSLSYGVYRADDGITFRGLFIIDDKGILRQITVNDLPVGRSVDETLRLVKAFQYTDRHGEVCPANWKPGDKTIVPDVQSSKEYFSKAN